MNRDVSGNERRIGIWLLVCCALLLALILLGGATRLTGSGLSMVDWRPVTGVLPPLTEPAWLREFDNYRQSPEYLKVNRGMSLAQFKVIFWYEYTHRVLARLLGLVFAIPLLWFWWAGSLPARLRMPMAGLLALGALQGYMGWYMVQSGLVDIPRVSPYRLAAHLGLALVIYAFMFRMAMGLLWPAAPDPRPPVPSLRRWLQVLLMLAAVTIVSGAFVAGLKAGLVYNTFPLMGGRWAPEGLMHMQPAWRNLFENPATVQFMHRVLALTTLVAVICVWLRSWTISIQPALRRAVHVIAAVTVIQVGLGIATLLLQVPVALGVAHQGGAVALLSSILVGWHLLARAQTQTERVVSRDLEPAPG